MVRKRLLKELEDRNAFFERQFRFKKGKSAIKWDINRLCKAELKKMVPYVVLGYQKRYQHRIVEIDYKQN